MSRHLPRVLLAALAVTVLAGQAPSPAVPKPQFTRELDLDRSGNDLRRDVLDVDATVEACEQRCLAAQGCLAFTFVKKSTTVPAPICWLKGTVPVGYTSSCCISGVLKR
jgi:PAN domain